MRLPRSTRGWGSILVWGVSLTHRSTRAYTGYIDVEAKHLFFYFFESRRDPDADDVVFWINGGPGGSAAVGLFMEFGELRHFWIFVVEGGC